MGNTGATDRDQRAREYLETKRALIGELERAMLAISHNALSDFEESLAGQEILTARLRDLQRQSRGRNGTHPAPYPAFEQPAFDEELANEVVAVHAELQGVNHVYEAVLRHSSHSASLMASLLDSFKGHFQEASGPRLKYQTWSCQM